MSGGAATELEYVQTPPDKTHEAVKDSGLAEKEPSKYKQVHPSKVARSVALLVVFQQVSNEGRFKTLLSNIYKVNYSRKLKLISITETRS